MSIVKRVWALLAATIAFAMVGAMGISIVTARESLAIQIGQKNNDTAQFLALSLSQHGNDPLRMRLMISSQFDTGAYLRLALVDEGGNTTFVLNSPQKATSVPDWFIRLFRIEQESGIGLLLYQWRPLGRIEVSSQLNFAYEQLWRSAIWSLATMAALAVGAGLLAWRGVKSIREPLDAVVGQAMALSERRFLVLPEPSIPDLREVTRALNGMVVRLKAMFEEQAGQVERLQKQANVDEVTGLATRAHFMSTLEARLAQENGTANGCLLILRLFDPFQLGRSLGRPAVNRLLRACAAVVMTECNKVEGAAAGRLNGADIGIVLPGVYAPSDAVQTMMQSLRQIFNGLPLQDTPILGGMCWRHGMSISTVLSATDQALAKAELTGAYGYDLWVEQTNVVQSEECWRSQFDKAVAQRRIRLVEYRLLDKAGSLVHLECPLRIALTSDAEWLPAAQWLPMAKRTGRLATLDLLAVDTALQATEADGLPRSVNMSDDSLVDPEFLEGLVSALRNSSGAGNRLWLEVSESAALRHKDNVSYLVSLAKGHGVRVGLEHAGHALIQSTGLLAAGLHFVKLDASFTLGIARDRARFDHVGGTIRLLHSVGLAVFAEGVADLDDLSELWRAGCDGVTGPVIDTAFP